MDRLRAITFFCRAVEAGSFAAAAQSLDVVPSALSKAVAALERGLGVTLLNRSTRKLALTGEGEAYYARCRSALAELAAAENAAHDARKRARGTLRVGMHPALRGVVLPEARRFLDPHPDVRLETYITNSPASLVDSALDVVICLGRLDDSSFVVRRLGWAPFVVCASPAYLERWGTPKRPDDLAAHRAVIYARPDEEPNTRWEFARGKERLAVSVRVAMVVRDGIGLVDAAAGGAGIVRPYEIAARRHVAAGSLRVVLREWSGPRHPVSAVLPSRQNVPAKVRLFVEFVEALVADDRAAC